jgi:tetratricopeptide (TPR) repeat protein
MNRGLVLSLQKRSGEAIIEILKAIEMNPKLARAYSMVADHYLKINRKDEALKYITEGLRHNPETKSLQKRYINLGGKTPYPEPVESQKKRPENTSAVKENAQTVINQTVIKEEVKPADGTKAAEAPQADPAKSDNGKGVDDTATAQKIGSPTNPWCRFCPVEPEK